MPKLLFRLLKCHVFLSSVDQVHSIPVQQMGNYQEYLKKMPASLREIETQPARLHMFGNPFKVNKVSQFLIFGNLGFLGGGGVSSFKLTNIDDVLLVSL